MEEKEENVLNYYQNKRKKNKIKKRKMKLGLVATILTIIGLTLIGMYNILNKKGIISYKETTDARYRVNLVENEFYEETYLEEGIDVVSNLIKNIETEFKYNLELDEEIEYKYSYKILAEAQIKEYTKTNNIYKTEQVLLNVEEKEVKSNKLYIEEKKDVDYHKYNDEIKRFLETYRLSNTRNELNISLYLNIINKSTGEYIHKEEQIMTVTIPLITKTVEATINENIKDEQGQISITEKQHENLEYILGTGIFVLIIGLITIARLMKYISNTRSAEKIYDDELKKILFDYKGYVQKINNQLDYNDYKVIKIDTFNQLLGMKEDLQSPILMYTEENNKRTTFIIISENLLFEYVLEARLIREKLIKRSKEKAEKYDKNK